MMRLAQGQLNLLETCPPQFQRIYLEQLATPMSPEQQQKLHWGSQFHLLMQQRELGLPIDALLGQDQQLQYALTALQETAPELFLSHGNVLREAEHCRTLNIEDYLLTVVYDLLILEPSKGKIIDWKTYLQPENSAKLAKNWQTRLYLYVLAETSDYLPEEISMTYWFVKLPTQPQQLTFSYNSTQHEKTRQDLTQLLTQLSHWLEDYLNHKTDFPHLDTCQGSCPYYQLFLTSQGTLTALDKPKKDWLTEINEIDEIPL